MKKLATLLLAVVMTLSFAGCSKQPSPQPETAKKIIVTTIFPLYDFTREILNGSNAEYELIYLYDTGADIHSFQATFQNMTDLASADLVIYVGGESEEWLEDALEQSVNPQQKTLCMMQQMESYLKFEEEVEGMQETEPAHDHDHEDEEEYDEHIWLSLRLSQNICQSICDSIKQLDPANADLYQSNAEKYAAQLAQLDRQYAEAVEKAELDTLIFADRFPFRYLVDDYSLSYYAAFSGCSAESEASFDTVVFLAQKADELGVPALCQIETSDGSIARTVRETTKAKNQATVVFDSIQAVSKIKVDEGTSYLKIMQNNLQSLKQALGSE